MFRPASSKNFYGLLPVNLIMRKTRIFLLPSWLLLQRSDAAVVSTSSCPTTRARSPIPMATIPTGLSCAIHPPAGQFVELGLSDNVDSLFKWRFPNYTLNAGSFLRIWCSGKNRAVTTLFIPASRSIRAARPFTLVTPRRRCTG